MSIRNSAWTVVLLLASCSPPTLELRTQRVSTREAIQKSSTILVGVIRALDISGPRRRTEEGIWVRTWRVGVRPLYSLKGSVEGKELTFFLNNYEPGVAQNGNFEWLRVGDRRIFFLTNQDGRLRSVADLYATSMIFPHRIVPVITVSQGESVGERIVRLLLTQAPGETAQEFVRIIPTATTEALRAGGYAATASVLSQLSLSNLAEVRTEACLTAYEQVLGSELCAEELARKSSPAISQRVSNLRMRRAYVRDMARQALGFGHDCPLLYYTYGVEKEDRVGVIGFLSFLAKQSDPVFQLCGERLLVNWGH